jgi:hypothetical protein
LSNSAYKYCKFTRFPSSTGIFPVNRFWFKHLKKIQSIRKSSTIHCQINLTIVLISPNFPVLLESLPLIDSETNIWKKFNQLERVPFNVANSAYKYCNFTRFPISTGIFPVNWFWYKNLKEIQSIRKRSTIRIVKVLLFFTILVNAPDFQLQLESLPSIHSDPNICKKFNQLGRFPPFRLLKYLHFCGTCETTYFLRNGTSQVFLL